jgi:hypothetical protein
MSCEGGFVLSSTSPEAAEPEPPDRSFLTRLSQKVKRGGRPNLRLLAPVA